MKNKKYFRIYVFNQNGEVAFVWRNVLKASFITDQHIRFYIEISIGDENNPRIIKRRDLSIENGAILIEQM